jgi:hypothetical protein
VVEEMTDEDLETPAFIRNRLKEKW